MPSWVGWALAAGVLLIAVVFLILKLRGKGPSALIAGAKMVAAWHQREVERKQKKLKKLQEDFKGNAGKIESLEKKLDTSVEKLNKSYEAQGLSADEIANRFAALGRYRRSGGRTRN